jgi:hypothetical protein
VAALKAKLREAHSTIATLMASLSSRLAAIMIRRSVM